MSHSEDQYRFDPVSHIIIVVEHLVIHWSSALPKEDAHTSLTCVSKR